jgi:hypothetical protein
MKLLTIMMFIYCQTCHLSIYYISFIADAIMSINPLQKGPGHIAPRIWLYDPSLPTFWVGVWYNRKI